MFIVSGEIVFINHQIMILVQLPELAVDNVEMFVGEKVSYPIDILLLFQVSNYLKQWKQQIFS